MSIRFAFLSLTLLCLALTGVTPSYAMTTKAKQAIVVDYGTGQVLFAHNADQKMPTSSMSKVMTSYAVFDALEKGQVALDSEFTVSKKAWKKGGSKMFIEVGKSIKVEDLLRGVIIQSGNDATIALAEGLSGQEAYFAEHITAMAKKMGMANSNFKNASGWPNKDHYSTARDLSILAKNLIANFPQYYSYFSEREFTFSNITQRNRNPLLYRNIGADGLKTGHTEVGGYGLIGSGVHDGRRVIVVVNGLNSAKERASESARLLEWGLKRFSYKTLFTKDDTLAKASVAFGKHKTVDLVTGQDLRLAVPALGLEDAKITVSVQEPVLAPITAGQELGTLRVELPEQEALEYPVYAASDVKEKSFIGKAIDKIILLIGL